MTDTVKKVKVEQLIPGMYIHDLDCDWMDHPFWRNRFLLRSESAITKIAERGIREVYIDTSRGVDVPQAPTLGEVRRETERKMVSLAELRQVESRRVSLDEERRRATRIYDEARGSVRQVMQDAKLGQHIELERVDPVLERMMDSVFRHVDALVPLARLKSHDHYTYDRAVANAVLMIAFGRNLALERETIRDIALGALLQDVGMVRVPGEILAKPGRLTDAEYRVMQTHVETGEWLLADVSNVPEKALEVLTQHHERYDGTGYPNHLQGEAISLFAQMGAIADVYDALTSDRPYQQATAPTVALRKLYEWSRFHFNPTLVQGFIRTIGIYPVGSLVRLGNGRLGIVTEQHQDNLLRPRLRVMYDTRRQVYLRPYDIDLAYNPPLGHERIVGPESFARWGIDPGRWRLV